MAEMLSISKAGLTLLNVTLLTPCALLNTKVARPAAVFAPVTVLVKPLAPVKVRVL